MSKPVCAQSSPYKTNVVAGQKLFWCTCGYSAKQPLCDGSHQGTGMKSHQFVAEETGTIWLCGCKNTKNPPFCDGSHLEIRSRE